jgi:AcrR family transcriptional regulator
VDHVTRPTPTGKKVPRTERPIDSAHVARSTLPSSDGPRGRGRPPTLTERAVVAAALRLTRQVGLNNLSMRALARELGVPPMTIYYYAPSKEHLHTLVVEDILGEIRVPGSDEGPWEKRLRTVLHQARLVFADHPGVSAHLGDGGSAEGARLAEGVLSILADGGFSPLDAVICFSALFTFMTGQIDLDAMSEILAGSAPTTTLDGVTSSTSFSRDQLFELGLDALVEGLKRKLLGLHPNADD